MYSLKIRVAKYRKAQKNKNTKTMKYHALIHGSKIGKKAKLEKFK